MILPRRQLSSSIASIALLIFFTSSSGLAQAAQLNGRVVLHGPPRSLNALRVTLRYVGQLLNASSQEAQATQPKQDGSFGFANVKPDIYVLQVDGPGILSAQWGSVGPELAGKALVVHSGDDLRDLTISVTARPVLCGRVVGLDGKPVANASVHAWKTSSTGEGLSMSGAGPNGASDGGNAIADAHGRYSFTQLNLSYYIVGAFLPDLPGGLPNSSPTYTFYRASPDYETANPIDLTVTGNGDACPYDLHLQSHAAPTPYSGPRYRVEGSLVDKITMLKPRKLEWELTPLNRSPSNPIPKGIPFDAASPRFDFSGIPPGTYRLTLRPPPLTFLSARCYPLGRAEVSQILDVHSDLLGIHAALIQAAEIRGHIEEIRTPQDVPWRRAPDERFRVSLSKNGACTGAVAAYDGSFTIDDLDPGEYRIGADIAVAGRYTPQISINGHQTEGDRINLALGNNSLTITQRFDSGYFEGSIQAKTVDGAPTRDTHGAWIGGIENILVLDEKTQSVSSVVYAPEGTFKADKPPGRYIAIAATNEEITWWFTLPQLRDERFLDALEVLATNFEIKPGKTILLTLTDHTVEVQNLTAKFGLEMYRR